MKTTAPLRPPESTSQSFPPFPKQDLVPPGIEADMDPRPHYQAHHYIGSQKLAGKRALISGGDSGIGRAIATLFAREGADVAFTYLPVEAEDADKTAEIIRAEGTKSFAIEFDLESSEAADFAVQKVIEEFGGLDILVNNAAFQNHVDSLDELDFEQFERTFTVNIFGPFKMVKAALPHFKPGAVIINTGSILGYEGDAKLIDYSATKAAIHTFTKSLAKELAERQIRVNSVAPGPVWTPLNPAERKHSEVKNFGADTLFRRPAQPEEIAPAFVFLASDQTAAYITGETINIFGTTSGAN